MIAILGGGVVGAALARALVRRKARDVVVLDPRGPGEGSTARAMGGFRTQHGSELNVRLSLAGRPEFERLGAAIDWQPNGYLYLADGEAAARELERRAELQRALGLPIEHPDPARLLPFLGLDGVLGANYCALDGLYRPGLILRAFKEEAESLGADFRYGVPVDPAALRAEVIMVCAGRWSRDVGNALGVRLDVRGVRRGVFQVGPFDWLGSGVPMTLEAGSGYHFREREGRLLVMGPGDQDAWAHFRDWLEVRVPQAAVHSPEAHWTGDYEVTFDRHPLVGPTERAGVWACCGFSGHGVMHAPAATDSLAAMVLGDTPPVDISPLDPLRTRPLEDPTQL